MKLKRIFSFFISCLLLVFISFQSFAAVQSSSNAVMALSLDDDYGISLYSSVGSVTNTISSDAKIRVTVFYYDDEGKQLQQFVYPTYSNGRWKFSCTVDGIISQVNFILYRDYNALPSAGKYLTSFDFASDFSYDYSKFAFSSQQLSDNVATNVNQHVLTSSEVTQYSGDIYVSPLSVDLGSVRSFYLQTFIPTSQELTNVGGTFAWRFEKTSETAVDSFGSNTTTEDFQNSVSYTANAIYDSLQDLIQHISNQLAALWDQMYNLMHVPTMAKLDEILTALRSIANNSNLSAVVDTIEDQITNDNRVSEDLKNGFDSSGLTDDKSELDSALSQYQEAEDQLLDSANEQLDDFEFDHNFITEFAGPLSDISYFLQGIFYNSEGLNTVIGFSLTLSIALILIGWYRFKGGV